MSLQLIRVNEYRKLDTAVEFDGDLYYYQAVNDGIGAGAARRVVISNITKIRWLGEGVNAAADDSHNIFRVSMVDGSKFITDWYGVDTIGDWGMFVRVDEYVKTRQNGVTGIDYSGHGVRVFPNQVVDLYYAGDSVNEDTIFTVKLTDGTTFLTDWSGKTDIDNWSTFPLNGGDLS